MPKVPVPATPVNKLPRRVRQGLLIAAGLIAYLAATGAAVTQNSSQIHLMVYSLGSALALIVAIKIAIKLFVYIVKTAVVLVVIAAVWTIAKLLADTLAG
jgi:hypothetical protein